MKKKVIILLLSATLAFFASYSQTFTLGIEGGYSISHAPVVGLNLGMNWKKFNLRGGFDAHTSDKVNDGMVFKYTLGHTFNIGSDYYLTAAAGGAYLLKSMDRKDLNRPEFLINPEIGYKWIFAGEAMAIYLAYSHAGDINMITIGIRGLFGSDCAH